MNNLEILNILTDYPQQMTSKQREFVAEASLIVAKGRPLSGAQSQYLQSIYDTVISHIYNLEPMSTDKEYAKQRAISNARKKWGK